SEPCVTICRLRDCGNDTLGGRCVPLVDHDARGEHSGMTPERRENGVRFPAPDAPAWPQSACGDGQPFTVIHVVVRDGGSDHWTNTAPVARPAMLVATNACRRGHPCSGRMSPGRGWSGSAGRTLSLKENHDLRGAERPRTPHREGADDPPALGRIPVERVL